MYPYFILFTLSSLFAIFARAKSTHRALAVVFAVVLVIFVGTRYRVGCDYLGYSRRFSRLPEYESISEMFSAGETGFYLLSSMIRSAGMDYSILLLASGAIYVACLWRFSKVMDRPLGFLAVCFPVLIVQLGMSGIRQALALGFLMLAMACFVEKKRLGMAIWILVASQFHTSAIIFLPLVYLVGRQVSITRMIAALVLLGPAVAWLIGDRLDVYSERYVEQIYGENSSSGAWVRYSMILLPFLLFEWRRRQVQEAFPTIYPLMRVFSLITFAMVLAGVVSSVALHRLVYYAMPISILAFICVARVMASRNGSRVIVALPFLMYGVYFVAWTQMSRHARLCYDPYQTWLF
ncbi:EpsG family protein [Arenimonas sp. MALMAid1274]|uniref:EpsG family protein n=1 Tax=Arenimonas sp. MALMAid1274 TaxID=3411630 RepID=UPI003BA30F67